MSIFNTIQSDLIKYDGMKCEVLSLLDESQYNREDVGNMYNIKLENGVELQAFEDELTKID